MFECVGSNFASTRCMWQKMATQTLGNVEEEWEKQKGVLMDIDEGGSEHVWADKIWIMSTQEPGEDARNLTEDVNTTPKMP